MTTISAVTTQDDINSPSQLSIEAIQNYQIIYRWIITTSMSDDCQLTLLGIIIALKSIPSSERWTIIADNEAFIRIGEWIIEGVEGNVLKEDVEAFHKQQEPWCRLFDVLPKAVSFHYRSAPLRSANVQGTEAADTLALASELLSDKTPIIIQLIPGDVP